MKSPLTNCVWKPRHGLATVCWSLVTGQLTSACDWWRAGHVTTTPASDWSAVAPGTLANVTCRLRCTETTVNLHTPVFSVCWCHISNTSGNYLLSIGGGKSCHCFFSLQISVLL